MTAWAEDEQARDARSAAIQSVEVFAGRAKGSNRVFLLPSIEQERDRLSVNPLPFEYISGKTKTQLVCTRLQPGFSKADLGMKGFRIRGSSSMEKPRGGFDGRTDREQVDAPIRTEGAIPGSPGR